MDLHHVKLTASLFNKIVDDQLKLLKNIMMVVLFVFISDLL